MRRRIGASRQISAKPDTCTERRGVDPTGISVKVGASYPGRSAGMPCATDIERCWDVLAEVSRGHSRLGTKRYDPRRILTEGLNIEQRD